MPRKIERLFRQFVSTGDRKIDEQEARKLIASAEDGVRAWPSELEALKRGLERHADRFTPEGAQVLADYLGIDPPAVAAPGAPDPTAPAEGAMIGIYRTREPAEGAIDPELRAVPVDAEGNLIGEAQDLVPVAGHRQVFLTPDGMFVTPGVPHDPQNLAVTGEGLFRAASIIDDFKGNLFEQAGVSLETRQAVFRNLPAALDQVKAGDPPPEGLDQLQALQLRSSSATVLLELITSLGDQGEELALKQEAFATYSRLAEQEVNPILRESMIFNAELARDRLTPEMWETTERLMQELAPLEPPYDKWFADGNNVVNIDVAVGFGFTGHEKIWEDNGFTRDPDDPNVFVKKITNRQGVETEFRIRKRVLRNDMFEKMDDPDTQIIVYDGHSNWGRNVRSSLEASRMTGTGDGKVALIGLCAGKGELNMMRDRFPDAQIVTTYNSSYFGPSESNMAWSENQDALMSMIYSIAERRSWPETARNVRDTVIRPHSYWHAMDNNYLFPTDTMLRRRVLDRDHDGQADIFDKLADFSTFRVEEDTAREFSPQPPRHPVNKLVGIKPHMAVQGINRLSLYSEVLEPRNNTGRVIPGGYFEPQEGDRAIVKFETTRPKDGSTGYVMKVNANYSHMSEEAMRAVAMYEFNQYLADTAPRWPLDAVETKLQGLILASHSLDTDSGYRDSVVWREFLEAYNFPPNISRRDVERAKEEGEGRGHHYSGSRDAIRLLREKLGPEILARLRAPDVGVVQ